MKHSMNFKIGAAFVIVTIVFVTTVQASRANTKAPEQQTKRSVVPIVYTIESETETETPMHETSTYSRVYYPLTMDEREWIAEMLAGKAADRNETCQRMVATVIYNDITACNGDIEQAARKYSLNDVKTPTEQIYGVVDDVFYNGELLLDEDVLYFNDVNHKSAFHDSLVYVCECDGIAFYKEHYPNIVSD